MNPQLLDLAKRFEGRCVLVVGDVMLDEYITGQVHRISPEAPVPVVEARQRTLVPGGAGNTAANVVSLKGRALLGGIVGRDDQAGRLRESLFQCGIETAGLIVDDARPTTTKLRIIAHNQQIVRVDSEDPTPLTTPLEDRLLAWVETMIDQADACILSDYAKGVITPRVAAGFLRMSLQARKPVVVDPKGKDYHKYRGATVITPNVYEAEQALGRKIGTDSELLNAGTSLMEMVGGAVLVTRGSQGMTLFQNRCSPICIPADARQVFDVTGAGDTVASVLALALAAGGSLDDAARLANRAGGIAVGKVGTARVTWEELTQTANKWQ